MSALDTLKDLIGAGSGGPGSYTPTLDPFLEIDVDALAREMKLEAEGEKRGTAELPPAEATSFDDIELSIIERIENEAARAHRECVQELGSIDRRLYGLDLLGSFSAARGAASSAIAEFVAEARLREGELAAKRKAVEKAAAHLEDFRKTNQLTGLAHEPLTGVRYWGAVSAAVLMEAGINSVFLRVNDDLGYLGGVVMALAIAVVNVFIATVAGKFILPQKNSVKPSVRFRAWVLITLYVAVAGALNLVGAHYRYLKGLGAADPGGAAITSFLSNPVGIPDFISWLLVAFGLGCSFLALWAGYRSDDEYPDYGRKTRQYEAVLDDYNDTLADTHAALGDVKDEANKAAAELERRLSRDRREYDAAYSSRVQLLQLYRGRHPSLEIAGNRLLGIYRTANRSSRTTPAPAHFDEAWKLRPLIEPAVAAPADTGNKELDTGLELTRASLSDAREQINAAFIRHVESFRPIADIVV